MTIQMAHVSQSTIACEAASSGNCRFLAAFYALPDVAEVFPEPERQHCSSAGEIQNNYLFCISPSS